MKVIVGFCLTGMAAGLFAQSNAPAFVQPADLQPKVQFLEQSLDYPLKWVGQTATQDDQLKEIVLRNDGDKTIVGIQLAWVVSVPEGCGVTGAGVSRSEAQMGPYEVRRLEPGETTTVGPYHLSSGSISALARQAHSPTAVARVMIYYVRYSDDRVFGRVAPGYPPGRLSLDQALARFGRDESIYPCQGKNQIEQQIKNYNREREQTSFEPTDVQPKAHFIAAAATNSLQWVSQTFTKKDQLSKVVVRDASNWTIAGFQLGWAVYLPEGCGVTESGVPRRWTRLGPYESRRLKPGETATVGPYDLSSASITALGATAHSPAVVAQVGVYRIRYSNGTVTTSDFRQKGSFGPGTEVYPCQNNKTVDANVLKTFTSPDCDFRFRYSQTLIQCTKSDEQEDRWEPYEYCESQESACGPDEANTLACLAYPMERFGDSAHEGIETFTAAEVDEASTARACLNPPSDAGLVARGERVVHGIRFKKFEFFDGWLGGGISGELYRTFHASKCYELGFWAAGSHASNFDSDETEKFTKEDAKELDLRLEQPLNSFQFLK